MQLHKRFYYNLTDNGNLLANIDDLANEERKICYSWIKNSLSCTASASKQIFTWKEMNTDYN